MITMTSNPTLINIISKISQICFNYLTKFAILLMKVQMMLIFHL